MALIICLVLAYTVCLLNVVHSISLMFCMSAMTVLWSYHGITLVITRPSACKRTAHTQKRNSCCAWHHWQGKLLFGSSHDSSQQVAKLNASPTWIRYCRFAAADHGSSTPHPHHLSLAFHSKQAACMPSAATLPNSCTRGPGVINLALDSQTVAD